MISTESSKETGAERDEPDRIGGLSVLLARDGSVSGGMKSGRRTQEPMLMIATFPGSTQNPQDNSLRFIYKQYP